MESMPKSARKMPCDSERGMRLRSRWQFEIGTQISVAIVTPEMRLTPERLIVEGIVVWCERGGRDATTSARFGLSNSRMICASDSGSCLYSSASQSSSVLGGWHPSAGA